MKIALLGYAGQGKSAFEYWNTPDNTITICDKDEHLDFPDGAKARLGDHYLEGLDEFDLLVRTPALHPRDIQVNNPDAPEILSKITSVTNEFFRVCPAPIIGVTGTKGKGTTSTLISRILEAAGKKVHLGGNIGIPPLELLKNKIQPEDIVVLELANFQLIDLIHSPHIAVCLMISPEHLNWHKDLFEYTHAKRQLFLNQQHGDIAIYNALNIYSEEIATASVAATKITYEVPEKGQEPEFLDGAYVEGSHIKMRGHTVCSIHDVNLLGRHNLQNVCAAIAATWDLIGQKPGTIQKALKNFTGLPNRLEPVRTKNKIAYYNDSFASAPGALVAALDSLPMPKVMIVGGYDRFLPLEEMTDAFTKHASDIRKVLLIGASAERVAEACQAVNFTNFQVSDAKTIGTIVREATELAQSGDAVVLSPGFASFDMFKNFEDRGNQFRKSVEEL